MIEMLVCPVGGCPWRYERPKPGTIVAPLTGPWSTIGDMAREAYTAEVRQTDAVVRAHLAGHPVEDFLATIANLRAQLAGTAPPSSANSADRPYRPDGASAVLGRYRAEHDR